MTSFGATNIIRDNFMPTFKIQGQIYHQAGSLLPYPDADYKFLQIYFIGDENSELDQRYAIALNTRREIICELQRFFNQNNALVQLFKIALDRMPSDHHKIVIRADRTPFGEHERRFNAPTIDEVAIVIRGDQFQSHDIILHRRNDQLQPVSELYRSYDALQYPILHWKGDDGYNINMPMIDPRTEEVLVNVSGPKSFQELRTLNGHLCEAYREACQLLHLLEDDAHWDSTLNDASILAHPQQIRMLFAVILSTCMPLNPLELWKKYKHNIAEDVLIRMRHHARNPDLLITLEMYNEALIIIEDMCLRIANKTLVQLGMTAPNRDMHDLFDRELQREQEFNSNDLRLFVQSDITKMNIQQKHVYDTIMQAISNNAGGLYFLDAPGGTGKTLVISLILATIRSEQKIALALASSGIAAALLEGSQTAHSALKLPLNVQVIETSTCNISRNSAMAKVLRLTSIILWDECTMANKKLLEAFNRTMQDLRGNQQHFGGALILLSTLPVIPRSTPADEINACLKSSVLWRYAQKLTLNINMSIHLQNDPAAHEFSKQLVQIGDGKIQIDRTNGLITIPNNFCTITKSIDELIDCVFPNILQNYRNYDWLRERAILAPKNIHINAINFQIQAKLPGVVTTYKSIDSAMNQDEAKNYPTEFLNSLEPAGMPPHCLNPKVGSLIILLRNINSPKLCNGTRLAVKNLLPNLIEATILTGKSKRGSLFNTAYPYDSN
ncbi:uncharacterized protein LOC125779714 [Bactrocera dorsalis]|uniref:ATP-dependent DNA helicase n=1 Tax=Bactrocera dorsalis TaxID=27457 RepID=A0ABM3K649_BACDO|nr:uncharacterized protein LOC125779714 [Bactrocera dorsalis]